MTPWSEERRDPPLVPTAVGTTASVGPSRRGRLLAMPSLGTQLLSASSCGTKPAGRRCAATTVYCAFRTRNGAKQKAFFSWLARRMFMSRMTATVGAASLVIFVAGATGLAQPGKQRGGSAPHPAAPAPHAAPAPAPHAAPPAPHFAAPAPHAAPPPVPHFAAPAPHAAPPPAPHFAAPAPHAPPAPATHFAAPGQPPRLRLELRTLPRLGQHLVSQHLIQNHILQVQRQGLSSPRRA